MLGSARLGGEVVHLVVEQEAQALGGDLRAKAVVQRGGDRDGVAIGIDHRVVRRVVRLVNGFRLRMRAGITVELREDGRTPQLAAGRGVPQDDGLAPGVAVALVDQLRDRNLGEIGIAQELGAIEERALVGLGGEVDALGRVRRPASPDRSLPGC